MRCKKCGKKLRENEKFCTVCGYYNDAILDDDDIEEVIFGDDEEKEPNLLDEEQETEEIEEFSLSSSARSNNTEFDTFRDDRFIEAYIGEDYKVVMRWKINIYALILTWLYFLYRKIYIVGMIGLATTGIFIIYFPKYIVFYIVAVMLLSGIFFNKIYITIVRFRIKKIKKKHENSDDFTVENICKKKGGVNFIPAILIYLIFLIIMFLSLFNFRYNKNNNKKFWQENSENKASCNSVVKSAYKILDENPVTGTISEGACSINNTLNKEYNVYLKIMNDNKIFYLYFTTENNYVIYKNTTEDINELELKKINNTITQEEQILLDSKKKIESNYILIYNDSKKEDELIKNKKNTSEKLNFIFSKEEILR